MRATHLVLFASLSLPLLLLTPATADADQARGGRGGSRAGRPAAAARPVAGRPVVARRAVARPWGYRPVRVYGGSRYYISPYYTYYGRYPYYSGFGYYAWWPIYGYPGYPWYPPYYGYGGYDYASSVRIQVTPKVAEVYVDGFRAGLVDDYDGIFQRLRIEPGAHDIVIYLEGYRSIRHQLYLSPGDEYKIREVMEPLAPGEPAEARPVPTRLPDTGRRVRPPYPGFGYPAPPRVRERPVPEGAPVAVEPPEPDEAGPPAEAGRRAPEAPATGLVVAEGFGTVVVRVQPADAEIYIDGERWRAPEGLDEVTVRLAAGPHRVEVRKPGHRTFAADVTIAAGATETVNVSLGQK